VSDEWYEGLSYDHEKVVFVLTHGSRRIHPPCDLSTLGKLDPKASCGLRPLHSYNCTLGRDDRDAPTPLSDLTCTNSDGRNDLPLRQQRRIVHCHSHAVCTAYHVLRSLKLPAAALHVVECTFVRRFESYLRSRSFNGLSLTAVCLRSVYLKASRAILPPAVAISSVTTSP
jgi:hypothetical protein